MIIDVERSCFSITNVGLEFRVSIFNKHTHYDGFENRIKVSKNLIINEDGEKVKTEKSERDSIRRARRTVVDYALCNEFDFFGTITLDDKKVGAENVTNYIYMQKELSQALEIYKRDYAPALEYLFVPELGENTGRLHFHFLIKGIDKTHLYRNEYNKLDWHFFRSRFGFINIKPIKKTNTDRMSVAKYCSKYITKSGVKLGKMRYFCSKTLSKPIKEVCDDSFTAYLIKEFLESYGYVSYVKTDLGRYVDCFAFPLRVYKDLQEFLLQRNGIGFENHVYGEKGYEKYMTNRELKEYRDTWGFSPTQVDYDPWTNPEKYRRKFVETVSKVDEPVQISL